CNQPAAGAGSPGSPKIGVSSADSASASSAWTDAAPASISASDQASTASRSTTKTISDHMPALRLRGRVEGGRRSGAAQRELLLEIVDRRAAGHEARVGEQFPVQRQVGLDPV